MRYEKEAVAFIEAIKEIAGKEENLNNLENYLSYHFETWLEKFAGTPADMAGEMKSFASMEI